MNSARAKKTVFTADQLAFIKKYCPHFRKEVAFFLATHSAWLALLCWAFLFAPIKPEFRDRLQNVAEWSIWLLVARTTILRYIGAIGLFGYMIYLQSETDKSVIDTDSRMFGVLKRGICPTSRYFAWWSTTILETAIYLVLAATGHFKSVTYLAIGHILSELIHRDAANSIANWVKGLSPEAIIKLDDGLELTEKGILSGISEYCEEAYGADVHFSQHQLNIKIPGAPQSLFELALVDDTLILAEKRYHDTHPVGTWQLAEPTCIDELYSRLAKLVAIRSLDAADRHIREKVQPI